MGYIHTKDEVERMYENYLKDRYETDIAWFNHRILFEKGIRKCISVLNKKEMNLQAKQWRKYIKDGKLQMKEYNNRTVEIQGETYYMSVIQSVGQDDDIDFFGMMLSGIMVSGSCYFFKNKHNRDAIFKFVNTPSLFQQK